MSDMALIPRIRRISESQAFATVLPVISGITPAIVQANVSTTNISFNPENNYRYTMPNAVQAGNALAAFVTWPTGNTVTISDTINGSWPAIRGSIDAGGSGNITGFFLILNVAAGVTTIKVTANNLVQPCRFSFFELQNITGFNSFHGTASVLAPNLACGSFTPTNNDANGGTLILSDFCCSTSQANGHNPTLFTKNAGHTLIDADICGTDGIRFPHAAQWIIQANAAAINPIMTATSDTNHYNCAAVALNIGTAGAGRPAGIYVNALLHSTCNASSPLTNGGTQMLLQIPSTGNLRLMVFAQLCTQATAVVSRGPTSVVDDDSVSWSIVPNQLGGSIWYRQNTSAKDTATITLTWPTPPNDMTNATSYSFHLYDISGAATPTCFDTSVSLSSGDILFSGNVTHNSPNITPTTSNGKGITIVSGQNNPGPTNALVSPSSGIMDSILYDSMGDGDKYDNADVYAHLFFSSNALQAWGFNENTPGSGGITAATFKSA